MESRSSDNQEPDKAKMLEETETKMITTSEKDAAMKQLESMGSLGSAPLEFPNAGMVRPAPMSFPGFF